MAGVGNVLWADTIFRAGRAKFFVACYKKRWGLAVVVDIPTAGIVFTLGPVQMRLSWENE